MRTRLPTEGGNFLDRTLRSRGGVSIDPEAEIVPDWKRTRDKMATRGDFESRPIRSLKKGGKVKKTGLARVHKGERVLTAKQARKVTPAKLRAAAAKRGKR